ncbi:MAG: S9 family peptidase [Actinobacteria bacterium]|nr:S9 family peptidase [Actinomycetota bacterium]
MGVDAVEGRTRRDATRSTIGGITFDDPYAWLEDDSAEAIAWQTAEDARTVEHIRARPGGEALEERLTPYLGDLVVATPRRAGAHWFRRDAGEGGSRLVVAPTAAGEGRVLVDAATIEGDGTPSIDWFYPSPDGSLLAYGVSFGGDEQSVLHLVEVASGRVLEERIPFTSVGTVAWLPDSSGFWHNGGLAPDFEDSAKHLFFHRVGQGERSQPEPLSVREPYSLFPQIADDGRYVAAVTSEMDVRPDFVKALPDGDWRPFLEGLDHYAFGEFVGDDYVAVTMHGAPRGRLVRIPVATGSDPSTWVELVPESDAVLRHVYRAGDHLVLMRYRDTYVEISLLDLSGRVLQEVELPGRGALATLPYEIASPIGTGPRIDTSPDGFSFVFSSLTRSPGVYHYDLAARRLEEVVAPREIRDDLVTEDRTTTAADGATVRYTIVHRADADLDRPRPAVIYGYGGWNIAFAPGWTGAFVPFVDAGGIYVHAHLRGGGELGEEFWQDGRLARKQHGFDDLYAIAEDLLRREVTTRERLAVVGGSNGGLLTGAAVTQRPDLFGVVVSLVGLYDMMKVTRDPYSSVNYAEYGDPDDPVAAPWLYAYSPAHNAEPADYPATLVFVGTNDMRCWPWHGRKLIAAIQHADTGGRPILLRAAEDCGHAGAFSDPRRVAEWMSFLLRGLDLELAGEAAR